MDMQQFYPLSNAESICKQFLSEHPEKRVMDGREMRIFLQRTVGLDKAAPPGGKENILTEDSFIPPGYNVMALRHMRHMPGAFHSHDFFEISCVLSGVCHYQAQGGRGLVLEAGNIVVFPPDSMHLMEACQDDCVIVNILVRSSTFDRQFFSLFKSYDVLTEFWMRAIYGKKEVSYLLFCCGEDERIRKCIWDIYLEADSEHKYKSQMLDALFHLFLIALLQDHEQDVVVPGEKGQKEDEPVIRIVNYIESEYRTLTLSGLAEEFNYSKRHITRLLKEYTGMGFGDIVRDAKLKRAVALLEKSSVPIPSIAEEAGYSDTSHFYRVFKRKYGCTPAEFRMCHADGLQV